MRLILDPGHGGHDSGATYSGLKEKDIVLEVCKDIKHILAGSHINIKLTREDDRYLYLTERCDISNDYHADFFLSVHCNADPDPDEPGMPEAKGEEIWYYKTSSTGRACADLLEEYIDFIFVDEPFRGIKPTTKFTVLKKTNAPANLVELGFIDNSNTWRKFSDPVVLDHIAMVLSNGIIDIKQHFFSGRAHADTR